MDTLIDYWNAAPFFPASCDDCIGEDGNLTGYHNYQLNQDPDIRLAYISSKQDATIAANLPGGGPTLGAELIEAVAELKGTHPDRFNSLISNGDDHTYLIRRFDSVIGGTSVKQWIADMIAGGEAWMSRSD
ncbi:hypothetical protein [Thioflexithrix psekupsensis]|uniref:Uncharacterized protein n=1 Tax=Thioflexithrix psekupsensis TaxID=1570016 RepID=A0A251X4U4_9GAMM|nr:hypothetical protein [Thioflexithrix psekupsensis]OUD12400.1 hypothetical protein TPSD3_14920 [Thioflexithrix psekupsensis]